jgi:hypothetical protein
LGREFVRQVDQDHFIQTSQPYVRNF